MRVIGIRFITRRLLDRFFNFFNVRFVLYVLGRDGRVARTRGATYRSIKIRGLGVIGLFTYAYGFGESTYGDLCQGHHATSDIAIGLYRGGAHGIGGFIGTLHGVGYILAYRQISGGRGFI